MFILISIFHYVKVKWTFKSWIYMLKTSKENVNYTSDELLNQKLICQRKHLDELNGMNY